MTFEQAVEHNLSKDEEALPTAPALEAGVALPSRGSSRGTAGQLLAGPLSQRELEVLHLLASGMSNQDIARKLFVAGYSPCSNFSLYNNVYRKLDVHNRTQAVARARELKML